jgi:hypothetical protein
VEGNVKYEFNCTIALIHETFIEFEGVKWVLFTWMPHPLNRTLVSALNNPLVSRFNPDLNSFWIFTPGQFTYYILMYANYEVFRSWTLNNSVTTADGLNVVFW